MDIILDFKRGFSNKKLFDYLYTLVAVPIALSFSILCGVLFWKGALALDYPAPNPSTLTAVLTVCFVFGWFLGMFAGGRCLTVRKERLHSFFGNQNTTATRQQAEAESRKAV
jgi:hypothetical protein